MRGKARHRLSHILSHGKSSPWSIGSCLLPQYPDASEWPVCAVTAPTGRSPRCWADVMAVAGHGGAAPMRERPASALAVGDREKVKESGQLAAADQVQKRISRGALLLRRGASVRTETPAYHSRGLLVKTDPPPTHARSASHSSRRQGQARFARRLPRSLTPTAVRRKSRLRKEGGPSWP